MIDSFELFLEDLGRLLDLPLKPDRFGSCTLLINKKLTVQLEMDSQKGFLQIASSLYEIPPGKYRENVLLCSLKSNQFPDIKNGILAFSLKNFKLVLCHSIPLETASAQKVFTFLPPFIKKALEWKEALESGYPAPSSFMQQEKGLQNPFGIKP